MTSEEKIAHVKDHLLGDALKSMSQYGRYWNASITRVMAPVLKQLISNAGYDVHMREISPHWEHVYYLHEEAVLVEKIAIERAKMRDLDDDVQSLPV